MKKIAVILFCAILPGLICRAGQSAAASTRRASATPYAARAVKIFKATWQEICKRNFDTNLNKRLGKTVFSHYLQRVRRCRNDQELAKVINTMIKEELKQSHIVLLPPVDSSASRALHISRQHRPLTTTKAPHQKQRSTIKEAAKSMPQGTAYDAPADIGLIPTTVNGKLYVLQLRPGFPAAAAGIKCGDRILAIDGNELHPDRPAPISWSRIAALLLSGYPATQVTLTIETPQGKIKRFTLMRRANGFKWFKLGVMPKMFADFEAKILPGNIGYIRFSAFFPETISRITRAVTHKLKNCDGLIIDLRDNVGGLILATQWLAGWLSNKPIPIGTLKIAGATLKPVSVPQRGAFHRPIAILVNQGSFSCAELFPAAMQDAGVAKVFGTHTLGKCLPSQFIQLPDGFRLQTVFGDHLRANGKRLEGVGLTPDKSVKVDLDQLRQGKDSVIEAARRYLIHLHQARIKI